jgi:hypothetical protein
MIRGLPALFLFVALLADAGTERWPSERPSLRLADPHGVEFDEGSLRSRGVVVVATTPTHAQGDAQKAWHDALAPRLEPTGPAIVILEDMSQSWFRSVAVETMKQRHQPGSPIALLLDENGATRRTLGVSENATVVFAFGPSGHLAAVQTGAASPERALELLDAARR